MGITDPYILDHYYVWFKNNCPLSGPLYDDIRFEPLHGDRSGKYFVVIRDSPHEAHKWTLYTGRHGFEQPEFTCGNVRDMLRHINSMAPESWRGNPPPEKRCILLKRSERRQSDEPGKHGRQADCSARLPPEAEQEILEALFEGMEIHSSEIAAILKKHGVCGDVEALQDSYRKRLGQRLMASLRDEGGKREVLANGKGSYVVLEGCGDRRQLKQIRRRIQNQMKGLDLSARKVSGRLTVLERLARKWRRAG